MCVRATIGSSSCRRGSLPHPRPPVQIPVDVLHGSYFYIPMGQLGARAARETNHRWFVRCRPSSPQYWTSILQRPVTTPRCSGRPISRSPASGSSTFSPVQRPRISALTCPVFPTSPRNRGTRTTKGASSSVLPSKCHGSLRRGRAAAFSHCRRLHHCGNSTAQAAFDPYSDTHRTKDSWRAICWTHESARKSVECSYLPRGLVGARIRPLVSCRRWCRL